MELKKYMALIGSILLLSLTMVTDSYATNDDSGISQGIKRNGLPETTKQSYVESLRKFDNDRAARIEGANVEGLNLADDRQYVREQDNELYIVDGLYRIKIWVLNSKNFPKSPYKFDPKYPGFGGVGQSELDLFFSQHYKAVMEEYFAEDYLTFYEIKILRIGARYIALEAFVRDASEFQLLLKDSRITGVNSIVSVTRESIKSY